MPDKERLTLLEAFDKFPEVCAALLGKGDVEMTKRAIVETDWGDVGREASRDRLCVAAMKWLEGKPVSLDVFPDEDGYWPADMLRCLLLEVQDQLHDDPNEPDDPKNIVAAFTGPDLM